tara:strand:- start:3904 stop:5016 length:1113 start_codon:yes stop_codon:yes gene_type:complete
MSNQINRNMRDIENNNMNTNNNLKFTNKLKNAAGNVGDFVKNKSNIISKVASNASNNIKNKATSLKSSANDSKLIQNAKRSGETLSALAKGFSEKNETVSKVIFIIFTFILFGLLLRLGVYILSLFVTPNKNPIIVDGMINTNSLTLYQVNPSASNSKPILRSINENQGIEFSWNTWIFIENVNTGTGKVPKRFFSKGGNSNTKNKFATDAPGLYLWDEDTPHDNTITITMGTFLPKNSSNIEDTGSHSGIDNIEKIVIKNIPIQKWVNVTIRVQNKIIDIYINGVLSKRHNTRGVVKQNYGDIYVGDSFNGPAGLLSSLRYFSYAVGNKEIQMIMNEGPNLKMVGSSHQESTGPYLASRWYLDNIISDS